ncbi:unnamed protein product, partial [Mesorhabditis belari]|uniref:Uncharacterized protein n=1 Tax=Mesorhabditis belari TaxID=2138241 RepID=A0AAF3FDE4_9BILA
MVWNVTVDKDFLVICKADDFQNNIRVAESDSLKIIVAEQTVYLKTEITKSPKATKEEAGTIYPGDQIKLFCSAANDEHVWVNKNLRALNSRDF